MGVPAYLVSSSIIAIMAQRLVRLVCDKCKQPYTPPESIIRAAGITPEMASKITFYKGRGCEVCNRTGYKGRTGIFELMIMSPRLRELAFNEAPTAEIRRVAVEEGMKTLFQDGLKKVMKGMTTLEELFRVAKLEEAVV
jgi:type IV pilus assembly protein PilB